MKNKIILIIFILIGCSEKCFDQTMEKTIPIDGLKLEIDDKTNKLDLKTSFFIIIWNETEELVLFPESRNLQIFIYSDNNWVKIDECEKNIVLQEKYIGIEPGGFSRFFVCPLIDAKDEEVKLKVYVEGNIYRGDMHVFDEDNLTEEIVFGTMEIEINP